MSIFRILHLSHLHRLDISQLLALLKQENYLKIHALLISGFYELDPHTELLRSIQHLNRLSSRLNLESEKVLCIPEPGDLRFSLSTFNNALFLPFFDKVYNGLHKFLIQSETTQILTIPDHLVPGLSGINQDMFDLKVRQADRQKDFNVRLFFSGNTPDHWQVKPHLPDPTHYHYPVFLHGNGSEFRTRDGYFGIGADANHFNVVEVDGMQISGNQFTKDGASWVSNGTITHQVRVMACKAR